MSSPESWAPFPGVTSSLLVSIKDDELETEGEERLSADVEDGGHKNDKVNSMNTLMGYAGGARGNMKS